MSKGNQLARERLAADVARFLEGGGRVHRLPNGASAHPLKRIDGSCDQARKAINAARGPRYHQ